MQPVGMGCMRLSTEPRRPDEDAAAAVIVAGLDAGVRLLDTADAYAQGEADIGHNERLIARALALWGGPRHEVLVATKGGLTRPGGRWVPNGRADHLRAACEASRRALGVERIALYQLHAPDPRVALSSSVRALGELRDEGLIERIGLCNVTRRQIREAISICDIAAVQVALSPVDDEALFGGVVELCRERGMLVLCHTPLGGRRQRGKLGKDEVLGALARRHGISAEEAALAWLRDLAPVVVPIPGGTRVETARSAAHAARVVLVEEDRRALDARFPGGARLRIGREARARAAGGAAEVVLLMGIQGAGKSVLSARLAEQGYRHLNRDARGGRLVDLLPELEAGLAAGGERWVLDNTYATRASRARVIEAAARHGAPVRCLWLRTPLAEAQINAVRRLLSRYGELPDADQLKKLARKDPHAFDPRAQFRFERELEPPEGDEGFSAIEEVPFSRAPLPHHNAALIVQIEGVLRSSKSDERAPLHMADAILAHERAATLRRVQGGRRLLGLSWQPAIAEGRVTRAEVETLLGECMRALGLDIEIALCPHGGGAPRCWCRTPLPGLAVAFVDKHALDPSACTLVGRAAADRTLAERMGFAYADHDAFFAS